MAADVFVTLKASIDDFQAKMAAARKEMDDTSKSGESSWSSIGSTVQKAVAGIGLGVAAIGVVSVKMASDFQSSMTLLVTGAGETESAIKAVSQGVLNMAAAVGTSPQTLAAGLYLIESAGFHGATGLSVLKAAAEGAKVGNADLSVTASAVTTVMHDYGLGANRAADATNFLVAVTANGKTHMDDLASALGKILPMASDLHVGLADVGGAMSTMTVAGVPADRAATALAFTLKSLVAPTGPARDALGSIGLKADELGNVLTHQGLHAALLDLEDHLNNKFPAGSAASFAALSAIVGGTRGLTGALSLTGANFATFTDDVGKTTSAIVGANGQVIGWSKVQQDANQKLDEARARTVALGIELGNKLIPVGEKLISWLMTAVDWMTKHRQITEVLAITIGTTLVAAFVASTIAAMSFWTAVTLGLVPLIAAIIVGIVALATHWQQVWADIKQWTDDAVNFLRGPWGTLSLLILGPMAPIAFIALHYQQMWTDMKQWTMDGVNAITNFFAMLWSSTTGFATRIWHDVSQFFQNMWHDVVNWTTNLWANEVAGWTQIYNSIVGLVIRLVNDTVAFFAGLPGRVLGALSGLLGQITQFGKDIMSAMANGITGAVQTVLNAIGSVIQSILDKFHLGFLASPSSKVMEDVGRSLMVGLGKGIIDHLGKATDAASLAANFVAGTVGSILPALGLGGPAFSIGLGGPVTGGNAGLGQSMAAARGWTGYQWEALNAVAMRESGWNNYAMNASSGAYGIAQALPESKYPYPGTRAGGSDPATQIAWMLDYISGRYGTPAGAWAHEQQYGWYDRGGLIPPGMFLGMNNSGANEMAVVVPQPVPAMSGSGGTVNITVNVAGSVAAVDDLAHQIRLSLIKDKSDPREHLASMTLPTYQLIVEVAFANNPLTPLASLTWTDISHYVQSMRTTTGHDHELQRPSAGTMSMRLTNLDARFNPFNTASPYYGPYTDGSDSGVLGLVPMKRVRVRAVWSGTTYPIWHGFIEAWPMVWPTEKEAFVDVTASDAFAPLNLLRMRSKKYPALVVTDTPTGYWRLGDPPGSGLAADSSGNNHPAVMNNAAGGVTFGQTGLLINDLGTSAQMGGGGWLDATAGGPTSTTTQSVALWASFPLSLNTTDGNASVLWGKTQSDFHAFATVIHDGTTNTGRLAFYVSGDNVSLAVVYGFGSLNDGLPHHIVYTLNASTGALLLYVDGVLQNSSTLGAFSGVGSVTAFYIGAAPIGSSAFTAGAGLWSTGPQRTYNLQEVAAFNTVLSAAQVAALYALGRGFLQQSADARIGAVLDLVGWPTADRTLEASTSQVQAPSATQTLTNTSALTHMQDAADTDGGIFFAGPDGKLVFYTRNHPLVTATSTTSNVTLGEGHEPYELAGTAVGIDDQDIWNTVIAQALGGAQFTVDDATSQARYGTRTLQRSTTLDVDPSGPYYSASYLTSRYKTPVMRVGSVTVHPLDDPTNLYPQALGRVLLDRVTVTRTPPGGGTAFSADYLIEKISHTISKLDWVTTWALAPVDPTSYLILNDAALGKLNTGALFI